MPHCFTPTGSPIEVSGLFSGVDIRDVLRKSLDAFCFSGYLAFMVRTEKVESSGKFPETAVVGMIFALSLSLSLS
jgi:hypothetical protein